MGVAFWFSLLKILLTLAANVAGTMRAKQNIALGEQKQISRMLKQVSYNAGIARGIEIETAALSPEQVLRDLEQNDELRD